jgi:hypothetical protein
MPSKFDIRDDLIAKGKEVTPGNDVKKPVKLPVSTSLQFPPEVDLNMSLGKWLEKLDEDTPLDKIR